MARKPVTAEMSGGKSPQQRIWEKIREIREFRIRDLRDRIPGPIPYATVRSYVIRLRAADILCELPLEFGAGGYQLIDDRGIEAPRVRKDGSLVTQGRAQEQMWNTLYRLGDLNARELAHHASTESVPVAEVAARDYLGMLLKGGYVAVIKPGKSLGRGGIQAKYRLIKRTGPRPPMVRRCNAIYDPNLHQVVWPTADAMVEVIDG
jgi:hypothetical protein